VEGWGRRLTLGVEEELFVVDPATCEPVPRAAELVDPPRVKYELFTSIVELATPVCASAEQVLEELRVLRRRVAERATLLASAMHPFARGADQEVVDTDHYRDVAARLGPALHDQLVCGLHVHVGLRSPDEALRAYENVVRFLPALLAVSANSPYAEGERTGLRSSRAPRLAFAPPPAFDSYAGFLAFRESPEAGRMWFDARLSPAFGTLELRLADQQTDVRRSAALAALVQALVARAAEEPVGEPFPREDYAELRARASREELPLDELAAYVEPAARSLGTWDEVRTLLEAPQECERQLEIGERDGLAALAADLVARSRP
jgi:carboxylate-amine ligase